MTNQFPDHCSTQLPPISFNTCKSKLWLALLLLGTLASTTFSQTTLTYDDGDLFIGFRATDGTVDYLLNVGQPNQFRDATPGTTFQVNIGNTITDLMAAFGSDWYTRIDPNTGRHAVLWAVTGGRVIDGSGDPMNILYSTNPSSTPWARHSSGAQSSTTTLTAQMGNTFSGNQSTANNPHALIQVATSTNSYRSFQPGGPNSDNISFKTWNPWNEAEPADLLFFNRILIGSGPSDLIGHFTLNNSGQLTFTAGTSTPTPTPTPGTSTPTPPPGGTATPTPTPTPVGTPATPTPTPSTPSPTPGGSPTILGDISTRLRVENGNNALIAGFIISGTQPMRVIIRAIGPSLPVADALADPTLELFDASNNLVASNDNWRSDQEQEIIGTMIPPSNDSESAIVRTLPPGAYTAVVRGVSNGTGVGLVEVYDLSPTANTKFADISTRGLVQTGTNVMIAGTIILGPASQRVLVRALGPSLPVDGALADPVLELRDSSGNVIRSNDNWRSDQEQEIIMTGAPPSNDNEAAIVATLPAAGAAYTAIVTGTNNTTGIAVVEVYALSQ